MRVYIAGFYSARGSGTPNALVSSSADPLYVLESYHYMNSRKEKFIRADKKKIFLDSGAFSMFTQGVTVDLKQYAQYIMDNADIIEIASSLDVIGRGSEAASYNNLKALENFGVKVMPVHHARDDDKWLLRYMDEGYDHIFLGGMVPEGKPYLFEWLDHIWSKYLLGKDGTPKVKIHGFGLTSTDMMFRYPWYCMTEEDHEVLTRRGWKQRSQLFIGEEILCFDEGKSFWSPILEVPTFKVRNAPIIELDNRTFSARVTPNHNWSVQHRDSHDWLWKTTEELVTTSYIPRIGEYQGPKKKTYSDDLVELMAWFWTDGHIKKRFPKYKKDSIVIYQSESANPEKTERIRSLIKRMGEKSCESKSIRKSGAIEVSFELYGEARDQLLEISPDKNISYNWLWKLTREQLKLFVRVSVLADGTKGPLKRGENFTLCQSNAINIDPFRIAALLAGFPNSRWNESKQKTTGVASSTVNFIYPHQLKKRYAKYTGNLWCVRVASKAFFTKCSDKIYVTGNSVDSTAWVMKSRYGMVYIPLNGETIIMEFSSQSTALRKANSWHYTNLRPDEKIVVEASLKELERTRYARNDALEKQLAEITSLPQGYFGQTLSEMYGWRDHMNIDFFNRICSDDWAKPFELDQPKLFT